MSDDWGDGNSGSAKKGGIPGWLMFCGGGCLLLVLAAGVIGFMGYRWARDGMDPDKGVENISAYIELDQVPEGYTYQWGNKIPFVGFEMYIFQQSSQAAQEAGQPAALQAILMILPEGADEGFETRGEPEVLVVQGTEVDITRHVAEAGESFDPGDDEGSVNQDMRFEEGGAVMGIDLSSFLGTRKGGIYLHRRGSVEEITDAEARAFLAPFHLGPDHGSDAVAPAPAGGEPEVEEEGGTGAGPVDEATPDDASGDDAPPEDASGDGADDATDDSDGR